MIPTHVKRPRNVDWKRAAAILYGDWGTSKAYVIGLAFAVAGYSSFWLIALMCLLTALVGANYIVICRLYPDGGGVYASVRHRSEVISIVGAFLLIADYLVTAAISALSAFAYLGVPHPEKFAAVANLARHAKVDPEGALRGANAKFERRFAYIEHELAEQGREAKDAGLEAMDALWDEAKARGL